MEVTGRRSFEESDLGGVEGVGPLKTPPSVCLLESLYVEVPAGPPLTGGSESAREGRALRGHADQLLSTASLSRSLSSADVK